MAQVCKKIQERREERRQEARQECRNVSRTISETLCSWMPWPFDDLCDLVTRVITELICAIVYVVVTIVIWVERIVCETIQIIDWIITHVVNYVEWLGNRIITFPEWLGCLAGINSYQKKFRICPIVLTNEKGEPVVPLELVRQHIQTAVAIYSRQCQIEVIAQEITVVKDKTHLLQVSGCNADGFFSSDRIELSHLSCCSGFTTKCLRFPSGLIWPRHVLTCIWVDSIAGNKRGCYLPSDNYLLVASTGAMDTLAHEMGHAGDLTHRDDVDNLMTTPTRTGSNLTSFQCCTVRTSKFVTIF